MRVTIKGITDATITFNTLGIIIRGNSSKPELYPNSIAKHIDIKNDEQMRELVTLKNAKLVSFVDESEAEKTTASTQDISKVDEPVEEIEDAPKPPEDNLPPELSQPEPAPPAPKPPEVITPATYSESNNVEETVEVEEIEDMPKPPPDEEEEVVLTIASKKTIETVETVETVENDELTPKIKTIKSSHTESETVVAQENQEDDEPDSSIVVMTPNGPMEGKAVNNMSGDMPESDATKASIEALKKLEEEEEAPDMPIDESKLDPSEQMGGKAIIATGESEMVEVTLKSSIMPEAEAIKDRGIKFIDPTGEDGPIPDDTALDESIKDVFIDDNDSDDGVGDDFIEC